MTGIPEYVQKIIETLVAAGHEAFIVGGCVRDMIRGATPGDWDIATSALPDEVKALFSRTFDTGIKHGTVSVLIAGDACEVTTYRVDGEYLDNRRPSAITFAGKIEEDLSRRDFTINAIAYSPDRGFIDPFGGRADISRQLIKCVGDPEIRFGEDALRMLRAIRFAAVLGFSVAPCALAAIVKLKENLADISAERVREELCKLLCGAHPHAALLLHETGIMPYVLRGRNYGGDLGIVVSWIENLKDQDLGGAAPNPSRAKNAPAGRPGRPPQGSKAPLTPLLVLGLFFSWAGVDCGFILRDLRFDNRTVRVVSRFVEFMPVEILHSRYGIKKFLRIFPPEEFEGLLRLKEVSQGGCLEDIRCEARDILERGECFSLCGLAVNGRDLAETGLEGRAIGETLERLLDVVMLDPEMNVKEKLLCL
ncbi:MAG: polynucleotide adenylyltransferase [Defluviitaleaceae bacterium]|nr:polynucleotide adenylyltransferase [Defluviitaleaceae bacterium]